MEKDLERLVSMGTELHGHYGAFMVVGIRMGLLALEKLESKGQFDLRAVSEAGNRTPLSCLNDGIQIATGCTLGKGNITVLDKDTPAVTFETKSGRGVRIELVPEVRQKIFSWFREEDGEKTADRILKMSNEELFDLKQ